MHAPRGRRKRRASDLADVRRLKSEVFSSVAHSLIGFELRVSGFWFLVFRSFTAPAIRHGSRIPFNHYKAKWAQENSK